MADQVHIISVGTSILGNLARAGFELSDGIALSTLRPIEAQGDRLLSDAVARKGAVARVAADPSTSAELSALQMYVERRQVDRVYLIATRTRAAECCARILTDVLRARGTEVQDGFTFEGYEPDADDDRMQRFVDDLQVLRSKTLALVRSQTALGHEVRIAAQGGYKPEVGVMMLVAAETGVEAYYCHEEMRRAVVLPTLLYRGRLDGVRELAKAEGRRLAGAACDALLRSFPELADGGEAERAHVVTYKRDAVTRQIVSVRLTGYGASLN